jgi:hypothetical protein
VNCELTRFAYLSTCTLGWMQFGPLRLATIERPWIPDPDGGPAGKERESCIGDGVYTVSPWNTERFPGTFILQNDALGVYRQPNLIPPGQKWGRSAILIHVGNAVADVIGCIAVGLQHTEPALMVAGSRAALQRLREVLGTHTHTLTIRPIAGTRERVHE